MTKKAIGLTEFEKFSIKEQLDVLYKGGVHIGKKVVAEKTTIVYQLNDFYIEVHFAEYRKEVVKTIISKNIEVILPYLDQVQIRDLDKDKGHP